MSGTSGGSQNPAEIKAIVFIVDDDESVRRGLCRLLRSSEYKADGFSSVADYLERGLTSPHDVLILDLRMPGSSGLELHRSLAERRIQKPVIYITAFDDARARTEAARLGAIAFLRKPIEEKSLLGAIQAGLASLARGKETSGA